jgi:hypothetical protein
MKLFAVSGKNLYLYEGDTTKLTCIFTDFEYDSQQLYDFQIVDGVLTFTTTPVSIKQVPPIANVHEVTGFNESYINIADKGFRSDRPREINMIPRATVQNSEHLDVDSEYVLVMDCYSGRTSIHSIVVTMFLPTQQTFKYDTDSIIKYVSNINDRIYNHLNEHDVDCTWPEHFGASVSFSYTNQPTIKFLGFTVFDPDEGVDIAEFGYEEIDKRIKSLVNVVGSFR